MAKGLAEMTELTKGLRAACITEKSFEPTTVRGRMESAFAEMVAAGMSAKGLDSVLFDDRLMQDLLGDEMDSDESMEIAEELLAPYEDEIYG